MAMPSTTLEQHGEQEPMRITDDEAISHAVALHEFCKAQEMCFDCPFFSDEEFCCFSTYEATPEMWKFPIGWRTKENIDDK